MSNVSPVGRITPTVSPRRRISSRGLFWIVYTASVLFGTWLLADWVLR